MPKIHQFPAKITVSIDSQQGDDYLIASKAGFLDHAEMGKKKKVAVYQLTEVREVEGVASHKRLAKYKETHP